MAKKTYFVRPGFVLHKKNLVQGRLTTQMYESNSSIDLDELEAIAYAHLIESKEQKDSRSSKK